MTTERRRRSAWVAIAAGLASIFVGTVATAAQPLATPSGTGPGYEVQKILGGYDAPLQVVSDGGPRLFVVEQGGLIKVARQANDGTWVKEGTFLNLTTLSQRASQSQGTLGMAFHPDYATNGLFYVFFSRKSNQASKDGDTVIAEFHRTDDLRGDLSSYRKLLVINHTTEFHYGGWLGFGPDHMLYINVGDGSYAANGQNKDTLDAKQLRIDVTDPDGAGPAHFTVPADNPYVGLPGNDLVWSMGLRNPWRSSFDRLTGDLYTGDVGESTWEEFDFAPADVDGLNAGKGLNYGWARCEGRHRFTGELNPPLCTNSNLTNPIAEFKQVSGQCSGIGGYVYRGTTQPSLYGLYFFGDLCTGKIWAIPPGFDMNAGDRLRDARLIDSNLYITSFGEGSDGEVYVVSIFGSIWHIVETS